MDPNANLTEQRAIAARILAHDCFRDCQRCRFDGERLAELVESLHDWIAHGGFPPSAWTVVGEGEST